MAGILPNTVITKVTAGIQESTVITKSTVGIGTNTGMAAVIGRKKAFTAAITAVTVSEAITR